MTTPGNREQLKKELLVFLIITFAATYLLEMIGIALYGPEILHSTLMLIPMYIPAVSAILCMVYFRSAALTWETKISLSVFLLASIVSLLEGLYRPILGTLGATPLPLLTSVVSIGAFLTVFVLNLKGPWREKLVAARLSFGKNYRYYLYLSLSFSALYILGLLLSHVLGLSLPTGEFNLNVFFTFVGIYLATFFISWPKYFGEEYGWRFYLQDRLFALVGGYKGVLLLGVIWGLWHLPLNLMGMSFPNDPVPGNIIYVVYTVIVGIIFSYAVLKTGSIWIAVLLHAITDSIVVTGYLYIADGNLLVAFLSIVVLLGILSLILLRSRIWKDDGIDIARASVGMPPDQSISRLSGE